MPEIPQRNFTGGELDPALHARADLTKYRNGLASLRNMKIQAQGGVSNREGLEFIEEIKDSTAVSRLIPFEFNKDQAYILEFGNLYMRVYRNGGLVLETADTITGATQANPVVVSVVNTLTNGDEVFISGVVGMTELNGKRFIVASQTGTTIELSGVDGTAFTAYISGGTLARIFTLVTPYVTADIPLLKYTQSADTMTLTHPTYGERDLTRTDHDAWTLTEISYLPSIAAPVISTVIIGGDGAGTFTKDYEYVVTVVDASGVESLESAAVSVNGLSLDGTRFAQITWATVPGADYYNIYKAESDVSDIYGWIGESKTLTFKDFNLLPDVSDTPPISRDPFAAAGDFPGVVGYYQQRQIFGRTNNNIQTFFATQSGNFKSMRISRPVKADDAIERTIASKVVNEIRHFIELDALLVLTSGGEWLVTEGLDGVLTPASIGFRRQTAYGSSQVPPLTIGNTGLFVQIGGKTIRDLRFQPEGYVGNDISLLAKHLFKTSTVKEWDYAQEPDGIAWVVMADGNMLGLTYQIEHQVWGFHRHDTNGTFESVAVIPENNLDAVYVIVKRTINGATKRYVERMKPRIWLVAKDAFIVDSGLTYSGVAATTISGLDHLEGEQVVALANANVVRVDNLGAPLTVTNGSITLADAATPVHIGLSYTSDFETLDVDPLQAARQGESFRGNPLNVGEVIVKVLDSRGGFIGPDSTKLNELPSREVADSYDPLDLRTTEYRVTLEEDWSSNGRVFIRQSDPLPLTILAVVPDVDLG